MGCTVPSRERWWASGHYGGIVVVFFEALILRSHTGTQMFTEFVAECRAERLKTKITEAHADVSAKQQKKESVLKEAVGLTAAAA